MTAIAANASCHREGVPVAVTIPIPVAASRPAVASATPRTSGDRCGDEPAASGRCDRHDHERRERGSEERHGRADDTGDQVSEAHDVQTIRPGRDASDRDRLDDLIVGRDARRDEIRAQERQRREPAERQRGGLEENAEERERVHS